MCLTAVSIWINDFSFNFIRKGHCHDSTANFSISQFSSKFYYMITGSQNHNLPTQLSVKLVLGMDYWISRIAQLRFGHGTGIRMGKLCQLIRQLFATRYIIKSMFT